MKSPHSPRRLNPKRDVPQTVQRRAKHVKRAVLPLVRRMPREKINFADDIRLVYPLPKHESYRSTVVLMSKVNTDESGVVLINKEQVKDVLEQANKIESFDLGDPIQRGSFGEIFALTHPRTGSKCVCKCLLQNACG